MLATGADLTASPQGPEPVTDRLSETQISVEVVPKAAEPPSESFSLQALVRTPSDLEPKASISQVQKKLSFSVEKTPEQMGFKLSPIPMCYHSRRRTPVLCEVQLGTKPATAGDTKGNKGIIKQAAQLRHKTVSFSTSLQSDSQNQPATDNKENECPEDIDLKDSLELQPQVPKATPNTRVSVAVRGEGETASTTLATGLDEDPPTKAEISYEEKVKCNRVSSVEPRILPKKSEKSGLIYCAACNKESRTIVVFEPVPLHSFQQLVCCWQDQKRQVLAVHKCVTCKRVIARILQ